MKRWRRIELSGSAKDSGPQNSERFRQKSPFGLTYGFGRRPFSCARWQRCHIRNAPFVLTQYGWFSLSQRSDAKSPGAEAPGLLFVSGRHATVSGVRFLSMEPVATDDVLGAYQGASPVAVRNPGSEKV
jgi:hypothetical protein